MPDDAYPILENALIYRERIQRKSGNQILGRLRRSLTLASLGTSPASVTWTFTIYSQLAVPIIGEPNAQVQVGTVIITDGTDTFTDQGNGTLKRQDGDITSTINYSTGSVTLNRTTSTANPFTITFAYYPDLPAMGARSRELNSTITQFSVLFDTKYAYRYTSSGFVEWIPGTTWTGDNEDFFWTTNYFVGDSNLKIFWATNFSGTTGDPIRYTNGVQWVDFAPIINSANDRLEQCLAMLPFRGRLVVFNTLEGQNLATATSFPNRIRWAAIGTPFSEVAAGVVTTVDPKAWLDDVRGKGGFLDIPTSESIISVGFVRDNLVIYCERSTWQLRYTGRSIAPFQIEKVNSELGAESTFSAVQFDTSLVGIGDKGVVECDSFKSQRIDIKIPDLVFDFNNNNAGPRRVCGIRNFQKRLAYWMYPYKPTTSLNEADNAVYPDRRLVYNYENDSWAIFTDSFTVLGNFQNPASRKWSNCHFPWVSAKFSWTAQPSLFPSLIGGNQQGYISILDQKVTNDQTLYIKNITSSLITPTIINSPSHNLQTDMIIKIINIPVGTPYDNLNNQVFSVGRIDTDNFQLWVYDAADGEFITPQLDPSQVYIGGGEIVIRDNFRIVSKKFNYLDQGQTIQLGYLDVLFSTTAAGAVSLNVYVDYNNTQPSNIPPDNVIADTNPVLTDLFFNTVVPTTNTNASGYINTKYFQRVICPTRGKFLSLEWTLNNEQMTNDCQESDVQIDSQILWIRPAGKQLVRID